MRLQNVILSVGAPWLEGMVKVGDVDEFVEDVHLMVQFGRQRRKITIRVSCDAGFDQRTLMFALNRAYDLVELETGHVVEKVTVRTIEKHRHFHGVSLDSVVKCMTIRAFEDFIDRVYEKKD